MSDKEVIKYISDNFMGQNIGNLKKNDYLLYSCICDRNLKKILIEEEILTRKRKERGAILNLSNAQIIKYVAEKYSGKSISYLQKGESRVYHVARERGIIDILVERNILIRRQRKNGFFKNMSDKKLIAFIAENYKGKAINVLQSSKDAVAYQTAFKRRLIDTLVQRGILIRKKKPSGFFKEMSNEDLTSYIEKNYLGKKLNELLKEDGSVYAILKKRKLINMFVKRNILVRVQRSSLKNIDYLTDEVLEIMEKEGWETLPSSTKLEENYSCISGAIRKYHGGFSKFRQILNERLGIQDENSQLESLLEKYVGDNDNY